MDLKSKAASGLTFFFFFSSPIENCILSKPSFIIYNQITASFNAKILFISKPVKEKCAWEEEKEKYL